MATADYFSDSFNGSNPPSNPADMRPPGSPSRKLHRIREVRLLQGVSLRGAARQTGADVRTLRMQEQEYADLRLSELKRWQFALDVPLAELLEETDAPLSRPVLERARLVRLMKTAAAIQNAARKSASAAWRRC